MVESVIWISMSEVRMLSIFELIMVHLIKEKHSFIISVIQLQHMLKFKEA